MLYTFAFDSEFGNATEKKWYKVMMKVMASFRLSINEVRSASYKVDVGL